MKEPHVLLLNKNVIELRKQLIGVLSAKSLRAFDAAVRTNVVQLFVLGQDHYRFSTGLRQSEWRQIISRAYYAAYSVSRSVRLAVHGNYSQESKDHGQIGSLPDDFPDKNTYANKLGLLRDDRNLGDYDHTATAADLSASIPDTLQLVEAFIADARKYLNARKIRI